MKFKKALATVLAGTLAVFLTACSSGGGDNNTNNGTNNTTKHTVNFKDGDVLNASNDKYEIEIHWNTVDFQQEIKTTATIKPGYLYSEASDIDGETFICAKMQIKNVGGESASHYVFAPNGYNTDIKVIFDNKYTYQLKQMDISDIMLSSTWSISPLKTIEIYFYASIPDELISKPYTITFDIGDTTYKYSH